MNTAKETISLKPNMDKNMYLYIQFADTWGAYNDAMYGFSTATNHRRVKRIKLTGEQVAELQPKCVGFNCGKKMFEDVSAICIQEE